MLLLLLTRISQFSCQWEEMSPENWNNPLFFHLHFKKWGFVWAARVWLEEAVRECASYRWYSHGPCLSSSRPLTSSMKERRAPSRFLLVDAQESMHWGALERHSDSPISILQRCHQLSAFGSWRFYHWQCWILPEPCAPGKEWRLRSPLLYHVLENSLLQKPPFLKWLR